MEEAREEVLGYLYKRFGMDEHSENAPVIIDKNTICFKEGWLFFYNGARAVYFNDLSYAYIGNAPIFFDLRDHTFTAFNELYGDLKIQIQDYIDSKKI